MDFLGGVKFFSKSLSDFGYFATAPNRIDDLIIFNHLTQDQLLHIVDIQLQSLIERLKDKQIHFTVSPEAKAYLALAGFDPDFGARSLKRTIIQELQNTLAVHLLSGDF